MTPWMLPSELDDIILDHLHDDRPSLAQCSLVCRGWVPTARHHLWESIHLNCTAEDMARFSTFLETSPDITYHIRNVVVAQKRGEVCKWYDLQHLHSTLALLARLRNLASIKFDGMWFSAPECTKGRDTPLAVSPSVRQLTLNNCSFDAFEDVQGLCHAFPALAHLYLDGVWWGRWGSERRSAAVEEKVRAPTLGLRSLDLGGCYSRDQVVDWLLQTLDDRVESLRIPLIGINDSRLGELLARVGPTLKHLEIGSPSSATSKPQYSENAVPRSLNSFLDISASTALCTISLGVPTYRNTSFISLWLRTILSQVSSYDVQELNLAVYPILQSDAENAEGMLDAYGWADLVHLMKERPEFKKLKTVRFSSGRAADYVQAPGAFIDLAPVVEKVVSKYFKPLMDRGVGLQFC